MPETASRPLLHQVMQRAADHLIPMQVSLDLTYRCNLACKHCYIDTPADDELSLVEIEDIFDQLARAGTMYLMFTGGEILARRDFFEIATSAREHGFMLTFLTNGTLITPSIARLIKGLEPFAVGLSLHGATAATHDGITRQPGSFSAVMNAVRWLKELGVPVALQTLVMNANIHEVAEIKALVGELGVEHSFGHDFVPTRGGSLAPYQYRPALAELYCHFYAERAKEGSAECSRETCKAGHGICSISPTGDVYPCLLMPMKVGNLRESRFIDIWKDHPSARLQQLRAMTWQNLVACRSCDLASLCTRCMGTAYVETGELTRPAPSACQNAALKSDFLKRRGVIA